MVAYLKKRVKPFLKTIKLDVVYHFFLARFFINKVAVTVEKDLACLEPFDASSAEGGLALEEITPGSITQDEKTGRALVYPPGNDPENRYQKAVDYLNKGYRGFALARGREVCGDIWYVSGPSDDSGVLHQDLAWLGIRCERNEAYAFDMHLFPEQRGKNMAVLLQNGALHQMRKKGFVRVFGYYWADYVPALWVHRTLKWKEVRRVKVSRLLFFRYSR